MKLYAYTLSAVKQRAGDTTVESRAFVCLAGTEHEADREAWGEAHQVWPFTDGWERHKIGGFAVDDDLVRRASVGTTP